MTASGKTASVLARGAPTDDMPFVPWFKDNDKLLAAVVSRAREDPSFAQRVVREIGAWARPNAKLRDALRDALKGARPSRKGTPYSEHVRLLSDFNALTIGLGNTSAVARKKLQRNWNLSREGLTYRLKQARAVVDPAHIRKFENATITNVTD